MPANNDMCIKEMLWDNTLKEELMNETLKEILGQLEDIIDMDDQECLRRDDACSKLDQEYKLKNILK